MKRRILPFALAVLEERRKEDERRRVSSRQRDDDRRRAADEQRRHAPPPRTHVIFVGGYFYDPTFEPYPWWPRTLYPHRWGRFDGRALLRVMASPRDAAVYVDGFYAGIVDDFD